MSRTLNDYLYPIDAAIAWLAFLFKLFGIRKKRNAANVALCIGFGILGVIFTISTPVVWVLFDKAVGVPNLAALVTQSSVIIYTGFMQAMLLLWFYPRPEAWRKIHLRAAILGVVLLAMALLFLITPAKGERSRDFVASYAHIPTYSLYLLVYLTAYSVTQIDIFRMSLRYAPIAGRLWLRRGLWIFGVGAGFGLIYSLARTTDILGALLGWNPHRWENVARLGAGLGMIFTIIGLTIPGWGPRLSRIAEWIGQQRAYRRLYPLWSALHRATPDIALVPVRSALLDRFTVRDLTFKLTRRVVEIRDGRLALRPYFDAEVEQIARREGALFGLGEKEMRAAAEAAMLASAIQARQSAQLPATSAEAAIGGGRDDTDMSAEVSWLVQVAQAFHRSPVLPATLAAVDARQRALQDA